MDVKGNTADQTDTLAVFSDGFYNKIVEILKWYQITNDNATTTSLQLFLQLYTGF